MEVYIDNRQDKMKLNNGIYKDIEKVIEECLLLEKESLDYEISLSFVDNEEIKELNSEYRNINKETDVLSFPVEEDFLIPTPLLGDIIISTEKALEQSIEYGHSLSREILYLTVHSMFHLLGYDHIDEEEKILMRKKEKKIMKRMEVFKL